MSASHPTFASGHCFMAKTLNKPEVEYAGGILINALRNLEKTVPRQTPMEDFLFHIKHTNKILKKMDHPLFEPEIETGLYFDVCMQLNEKNTLKQNPIIAGPCLAAEAKPNETGFLYKGKIYVPAWPSFYSCIDVTRTYGHFTANNIQWTVEENHIIANGLLKTKNKSQYTAIATPRYGDKL